MDINQKQKRRWISIKNKNEQDIKKNKDGNEYRSKTTTKTNIKPKSKKE